MILKSALINKGISATKYTLFFRIISQIIGAITVIFLVRAISEHDYGVYNLLYSVIALLGMVFSLGIANTLQRYMPEYYERGEFVLAHRVFRFASIFRLVSNITILALFLIFWDLIAPFLKIVEYKNYFIIFTIVIVLHLQRGLLETALNSFFLHKYSQGISVIFIIVKGLGYGIALFFDGNLFHIIIADVSAYIIAFLCLEIIYWIKVPLKGGTQLSFTKEERKRLNRYAFYYNFNDIGVGVLDSSFDHFVIAMILNPVSVGAYAFSHRINNMVLRILPISYLIEVIRPLFIASNVFKKSDSVVSHFQILIKFIYVFQFPVLIFFILLSDEIIILFFGGKFVDFYFVIASVALFNFCNAIQIPIGLVAQLFEKSNIIFYSKIFSVYNLLADLILIYYFDILGAVIATGTAIFFKNIFVWYYVRDSASFSGMFNFFKRQFLFWFLIFALCCLLNFILTNIYYKFLLISFLLFISFFVQFKFIIFNTYEINLIQNIAANNKQINSFFKIISIFK